MGPPAEAPWLRVLFVDDDAELRDSIGRALLAQQIACDFAPDVERARQVLWQDQRGYDIILLDIDMPGDPGWELLAELRGQGDETPVIVVTGLGEVDDRVRGLAGGADDYLIKPFEPRELLARIKAVVRRTRTLPDLRAGNLRLDSNARTANMGAVRIELSQREFDLLRVLVEARGDTVGRGALLREIWGIERDPETAVVEVLVNRVRRKLGRDGSAILRTVRGAGYQIVVAD